MPKDEVTTFITGATGYIGGAVLQRLLQHPHRENFEISALVRNVEKAKLLVREFGVRTVVGSLQDSDKLKSLAENAHVVIHTADSSDNVDAIRAILGGLKARHEKTQDVPHLIHTSGTGEFMEDVRGEYPPRDWYSDLDVAKIESLPPTAFHREVDLLVIAADTEGYARTHIVLPSNIYGIATGPLFDAGISNPNTIFVPMLVKAALQRGSVGVMGQGVSQWADIHIEETADLYALLFDALLHTPEKVSHGREGYFFGVSDYYAVRDVLRIIADTLFAMGSISTAELVPYAEEELDKLFWNKFIGRLLFANTPCKAERAQRELGWTPRYTNADLFAGLKPEIEILVRKEDSDAKQSS
ncbi:NAD-P-binding protein [Pilatotrama ljubarskyi]|nr:NAD-P-binding protein [Pilatotrama ljubarskyi]